MRGCSVPLRSDLGSLLSTIFINDLPERVKNGCRLYADERKLKWIIEKEEDFVDIQNDTNSMQN